MEIENTTLGGSYSQKLHFRTHKFGTSHGRRLTIDEQGFVGIGKPTPDCMLHIRDISSGGLYTDLQKAIILGADGQHTTTGLNLGNHSTRPFLWCGNNGTATVNATTFTHGWGWTYATNGNLVLNRKNGPGAFSVVTYNRSDGCVTFTNNSPGCASDDRLKFNETNIENALDTIMKLSPEIYDKIYAPNDEDDFDKFDPENSYKESGFIAQEVEQIEELKFLVRTGNDKFKLKSINYTGIIPYNTKAIQELKIQNDELQKKNKNIVDELYEMQLKLDLLMKHLKL